MNIEWCYCEANERNYEKLKKEGYEPNLDSIEMEADDKPLYYIIEEIGFIWKSIMKPSNFTKISIKNGKWSKG